MQDTTQADDIARAMLAGYLHTHQGQPLPPSPSGDPCADGLAGAAYILQYGPETLSRAVLYATDTATRVAMCQGREALPPDGPSARRLAGLRRLIVGEIDRRIAGDLRDQEQAQTRTAPVAPPAGNRGVLRPVVPQVNPRGPQPAQAVEINF